MMARFLQAALVTALTASTPAFAQSSSVVNLILPAVDAQTIVGSVINAGPTATTYAVSCPSGTDDADCGLGPGLSVVQGPSTLEIHETFQSA